MPTASEDKGEHDSRIIQKMSNLWHNIEHWSQMKTHTGKLYYNCPMCDGRFKKITNR